MGASDEYEEYHETRQSILQSEDPGPVCDFTERTDCPYCKVHRWSEEWGMEYEFECTHPGMTDALYEASTCPLARPDDIEGEGGD